jgi:regulation of enolase protein 1 (concanavalin A-like superfamily)
VGADHADPPVRRAAHLHDAAARERLAATITALPFGLEWLIEPQAWSVPDDASLVVTAGPRTDWFVDPQGSAEPTLNAPALLGRVGGDFLLGARVTVDLAATYDAGALVVHVSDRIWAKLCFEYSPDGEAMVVSVVTRELSDDCNSFVVDSSTVWLRVARLGPALAFHASTDGSRWSLVRHFALDLGDEPSLGFLAQSPTGEGCTVTFERIAFAAARLADLRSGV